MTDHARVTLKERAVLDQMYESMTEHYTAVGCDSLHHFIAKLLEVKTRDDLIRFLMECESPCCAQRFAVVATYAAMTAREIRNRVMMRQNEQTGEQS